MRQDPEIVRITCWISTNCCVRRRARASDVHIKVGSPPFIRIDGRLERSDFEPAHPGRDRAHRVRDHAQGPGRGVHRHRRGRLRVLGSPGLGRFRVNVFRQRGSVGLVLRARAARDPDVRGARPPAGGAAPRREPARPRARDRPDRLRQDDDARRDDRLTSTRTRQRHIVTIEDPIEVLHADKRSIVNQREVGTDTADFAAAMRRVLRQDPDVILVGEMRDPETVRRRAGGGRDRPPRVLDAAHDQRDRDSINRIIDFFPPHEQRQARMSLAASLRGHRQPAAGRAGRRRRPRARRSRCWSPPAGCSTRSWTPTRPHEIEEIIAEGEFYGMQTFDQSLLGLYKNGLIGLRDAGGGGEPARPAHRPPAGRPPRRDDRPRSVVPDVPPPPPALPLRPAGVGRKRRFRQGGGGSYGVSRRRHVHHDTDFGPPATSRHPASWGWGCPHHQNLLFAGRRAPRSQWGDDRRPQRLRPLLAPESPLQDLARRFRDSGYSLHLVGGSVRDALLGITNPDPDYDLTTEARPDAVLDLVRGGPTTSGSRVRSTARSAGRRATCGWRSPPSGRRSTGPTAASRRSSSPTRSNTDLSRRDFTVNAMAISLPEPNLADPYGGLDDLPVHRRLRTPLDPEISFLDHPLRMVAGRPLPGRARPGARPGPGGGGHRAGRAPRGRERRAHRRRTSQAARRGGSNT